MLKRHLEFTRYKCGDGMIPFIHVQHVFYPYFHMDFSHGYRTCQSYCKSLGSVLDTLIDTSVKTAKHEEKLQPDFMRNSKLAVKLLNLLKGYPSGCVACILFVLFSYPIAPNAFSSITNVKHEVSDCGVKSGY